MSLTKSTLVVSITIFVSRIFGCIRDAIFAFTIGTGPLNDAFTAAFKLVNLFRIMFGEGGFSSAFTPVYSKDLTTLGRRRARTTAIHAKSLLVIIMLIITVAASLNMGFIIKVTAPGFQNDQALLNIAINTGLILFPYSVFVAISAFYGSVLQSHGIFSPYFSTSIIMNIVTISAVLIFGGNFKNSAYALAFSTLTAGVCELLWMIGWGAKYKILTIFWRPRINTKSILILKRMGLSLITISTSQINVWINMALTSFIPGSISYIYYADRVTQLPLALIGTALSATILPKARFLVKRCNDSRIEKCIMSALCLSIPSMFGVIALSQEIVSLLFERGKFDRTSVIGCSAAAEIMILALPSYVLTKIYFSILNGNGKTRNPAIISIFILIINTTCSMFMVQKYSYLGVMYSNCASSYSGLIISSFFMHKFNYFKYTKTIILETIRYIISGAAMFIALIAMKAIISNVLILIACGITMYFALLMILKSKILLSILAHAR